MKKLFFLLFVLVVVFSSCNQSDIVSDSLIAEARTSSGVTYEMVTNSRNNVTGTANKVSISNASNDHFEVTLNPGTSEEVTYTVISFVASHDDQKLRVIKNPGSAQVVYENKYLANVSVTSGALGVTLSSGPIVVTGSTSVIIEEMGGI